MTQEEKLECLLDFFKKESVKYKEIKVANKDKKMLLRSLMNLWMPKPISEHIRVIQNEFLQEEVKIKGIVSLDEVPTIREQYQSNREYTDQISIWKGDITRLKVDAIVNAANSQLLGCFVPCHQCIDNAIHSAAGIELREECNQYMHKKRMEESHYEEPTGSAMLTAAYNLPCKHVIHTVGPIVGSNLTKALREDLRSCYETCLNLALEYGIRSIAFCCISTGEFRFPNEEAAKIAIETVTEFLKDNSSQINRVIFNVFQDLDQDIYEQLLKE